VKGSFVKAFSTVGQYLQNPERILSYPKGGCGTTKREALLNGIHIKVCYNGIAHMDMSNRHHIAKNIKFVWSGTGMH
jgi:hypothetical protein